MRSAGQRWRHELPRFGQQWAGFGGHFRGLEQPQLHVGHAFRWAGRDLFGESLFVIGDDSLDVEDT
ncbi:hypothetical protein AB0L63_11935 [Nocardia sp. NPDC051990]|uniref:hypothetical protein n=1 Tax=Nocardia sp. NPDC051990 TaxID=3155285 RepID=UPI00343ED67C